MGRKDEAIRAWNEALHLNPDYPEAQYNLGTSLLAGGNVEQALPHLQTAVKGTPNNANAHENLGNAYLKLDRLAEATTQFASAAALAPDNAVFMQALGMVLLKQSKWNEAATMLTEALKRDPKSADANRNLGIARINQGNRPAAIRLFSEAVRLEPRNSDIRFNLGLALLEDNQPAQAAEQFTECLQLNPRETRSHYRLAVALSQQHQIKGAIFHYREALRLTPDFPDAMNELARLLACAPEADLREGAEAVRLAEKASAMTNNQQAHMLIFQPPNCAPSIDGRLDACYSRSLIAAHWKLYNGEDVDEKVLPIDAADLALLPSKLAGTLSLRNRPGWRVVYFDETAALLARDVRRFPGLARVDMPVQGPKETTIGRMPFPNSCPRSNAN